MNTPHTLMYYTNLRLDLLTQHREPHSSPLYSHVPLMVFFFPSGLSLLPLMPNQLQKSLGIAQKSPMTLLMLDVCFPRGLMGWSLVEEK